ncbi:MAG: hypothetical protein KC766_06760 [Myxococcales bacterium]|nr:hypothetical protein [Myxococcales bacterium]
MSRLIMPYTFDLAKVTEALGSGSPELHQRLNTKSGEPQTRAARALIDGKSTRRESAADTIHAFEAICLALGRMLPNAGLYESDALEQASEQLEVLGLDDVSPITIISNGSPIPLPSVEDYPMVGNATHEACLKAWDLIKDNPPQSSDSAVDQIFITVYDYLELAVAWESGLIGFIY